MKVELHIPPKDLEVSVTKLHIALGEPNCDTGCPIALAAHEALISILPGIRYGRAFHSQLCIEQSVPSDCYDCLLVQWQYTPLPISEDLHNQFLSFFDDGLPVGPLKLFYKLNGIGNIPASYAINSALMTIKEY